MNRSDSRNSQGRLVNSTFEPLESRCLLSVSSTYWDITTSSYLGGSANDDSVRGAVVQPDGTIVLAANISNANPGGLTPILLNGASPTSSGAILRLSGDGKNLLSVTRLSNRVLDLSNDSAGNLYVAMWTDGVAKLTPDASSLIWSKSPATLGFANVQRVDAGPLGYSVVLGGGNLDADNTLGDWVQTYDPQGNVLSTISNSRWKNDVTIDETSQTIIYLGYRNATDSASGLPVQISYYRGHAYDGTIKYTGYDFSADQNAPNYLNAATNNMADTRGYRAEIGEDGKLYLGFESAGGNFLFRYNPFDSTQPVTLAGGDAFQSTYGVVDSHITIVGRYDPATGAFLGAQELVGRLPDGSVNTVRIVGGTLAADAEGRVYVGGTSAWGLPIPGNPSYVHDPARPGFNPGAVNDYLGGSYLWVLEPDLNQRAYVTRLSPSGTTRAIAVHTTTSGTRLVFGGDTTNTLYTLDASQPTQNGSQDGFFAVVSDSDGVPGNSAPQASFIPQTLSSSETSYTLRFVASATDPDNDTLTYYWNFGDGTTAVGTTVDKTFSSEGTYNVILTVRDGRGGYSQDWLKLGPPSPVINVNFGTGTAPVEVQFDASASTAVGYNASDLTYEWDFGDGSTAGGIAPTHTYTRGGVYTITLKVTNPLGVSTKTHYVLGIAKRTGYSKRLDLNTNTSATAPGYLGVPLSVYNPATGYGWQTITQDYNASRFTTNDPLYGDYHEFAKYPTSKQDGTFLIDVPNGTYTVILRFGHKDSHSFGGVIAEGLRETSPISVENNGIATAVFTTTVTDGRLDLTFIREWWFISAIEVLEVGNAEADDPTASFRVDPIGPVAPADVRFDATGGDPTANLSYNWNLGNGQTANTPVVRSQYPVSGTYNVSLTVTGGTSNRIISFGGDMVQANTPLTGIRGIRNTDLDNDGQADDTTAHIPLGTDRNSAFLYLTDPSARLYGGISNIQRDNPTGAQAFSSANLINNGTSDYLDLRDQPSGVTDQVSRSLLLWRKENFENGGHAQRVSFDTTGSLSLNLARMENLTGRWVIRNGNTFYISSATFTGSGIKTINPNSTTWAVYTPSGPLVPDFDQSNATFSTVTFDNVQAVGVFLERDGGPATRVWYQIREFNVDATLNPVNYALIVSDPPPSVSVLSTDPIATEAEQTSGRFLITRSGNTTDPLTVYYSLSGTASESDYTSSPAWTGSVTIPAGSASVEVTIVPTDDSIIEGTESLILTLTEVEAYTLGASSSASISITDDDGFLEAPTGLSATTVSSRRINLSWTDNAASETGFRVERQTNGGMWELIASLPADSSSFVDTSVTGGNTYRYRVQAFDSILLSDYSNIAVASTPAVVIDDIFNTNQTSLWDFLGYGTVGNPTEDYLGAGVTKSGFGGHDGVLRAKGYHVGTSGQQAAINYRSFSRQDIRGSLFSTTGIHASTATTVRLAVRYDNGNGPLWAVSGQSIRTSNTTVTSPIPGSWNLSSFDWYALDTNNLLSIGSAVDASVVLKYANAIGGYSRTGVGSYQADQMGQYDSMTLSVGVPSPVGNLIGTSVSPTSVNVTWVDLAETETGYRIERSIDGVNYTVLAALSADSTSYSDTSVNPETSYYYRVTATGSSGDSDGIITQVTTLPALPAGPTSASAVALSPSVVQVTWSDDSNNETGFIVERSLDGVNFFLQATVAANVTSYNDSSVIEGQTYIYRVIAFNSYGQSTHSQTDAVTVPYSIPTAPTGLTATAASTTSVELNWNDNSSNETGFRIERSEDAVQFTTVSTVPAGQTSFTDTGLSPRTTYYYRLQATGPGGSSDYSNLVSITTPIEYVTLIDQTFTSNTTSQWSITGYGTRGNPTRDYIKAGVTKGGFSGHDGLMRVKAYHVGGTSSDQAAILYRTFSMTDLTYGQFSTTGIHAALERSEARLVILYDTGSGTQFAVSGESVRTSTGTSTPVPGVWDLSSFTWYAISSSGPALLEPNSGSMLDPGVVLRHAVGTGIYSKVTEITWGADYMAQIDSFTLTAGT